VSGERWAVRLRQRRFAESMSGMDVIGRASAIRPDGPRCEEITSTVVLGILPQSTMHPFPVRPASNLPTPCLSKTVPRLRAWRWPLSRDNPPAPERASSSHIFSAAGLPSEARSNENAVLVAHPNRSTAERFRTLPVGSLAEVAGVGDKAVDRSRPGGLDNDAVIRDRRSATSSKKGWPERDSNPRHRDFQSPALPTELSGHHLFELFAVRHL
jgi:hypothetical protein